MAREFIAPGNIFTGAGALDMAEDKLSQLGKKALIVTDNVMVELGNCAKVEAALKNGNVDYVVYHEINGEPTDVMINKGLELYKENGCDFLVALGGGSPIDSMKAIATIWERSSVGNFQQRLQSQQQQVQDQKQHSLRSSQIHKMM